jgi:RNA polymerase sigma-70 factor (ECF subfamily)
MTVPVPGSTADAALSAAIRAEAGTIVASLHRLVGDFDIAEEAVQDAVVEALRAWRRSGIPDRPGAWLHVAARRNALDRLRKQQRQDKALGRLRDGIAREAAVPDVPDERLPLLFGCCHPSLAVEARLALTLRAVVGLTTAQIARAFLVSEQTLAQRIVRAKRKIVDARIPLTMPSEREYAERLDDVLTVAYLMFNEGFVATVGRPDDRDLADDALWLAGLVATSLPEEPEALGLLALLTFQHARQPARFADDGSLVLLEHQDRSRWDRAGIAAADRMLERAAAMHRAGRFQLQAAIAGCHASAGSWGDTDWLQILVLYDMLLEHDRSPVTRLNRGIAMGRVWGAAQALAYVEPLGDELDGYHLFHATRASLLRELDRRTEAEEADARALALTRNPAEQSLLRSRLGG